MSLFLKKKANFRRDLSLRKQNDGGLGDGEIDTKIKEVQQVLKDMICNVTTMDIGTLNNIHGG